MPWLWSDLACFPDSRTPSPLRPLHLALGVALLGACAARPSLEGDPEPAPAGAAAALRGPAASVRRDASGAPPVRTLTDADSCALPEAPPACAAFDWRAWVAAHPPAGPGPATAQRGEAQPAPFRGLRWSSELRAVRQAWSDLVGPIPEGGPSLDPREEPLCLSAEELGRVPAGLLLRRFSYRGAHGARIPALLLTPSPAPTRAPAVLVMHQALVPCGKKEPMGVCLQGSPLLSMGRELAQAGYVVLAPDSVGFGERRGCYDYTGSEWADGEPLLRAFPGATLTGLRISDVRRGLSFLQGRPEVDRGRLAMGGHSNGGIEALFSAAFDDRIRCALVNAGPNLVRRETLPMVGLPPGIARWAGFGYLPGMAHYRDRVADLPVEFHQLYALVAPRGLYVAQMEDDSIAPAFDRIDFAFGEAARAFAAVGGSFVGDKIASGLTPACQDEWAAPMCLSRGYDRCADDGCRARYAQAGMDGTCASTGSLDCAHRLYWGCRQGGGDEDICLGPFRAAGVDVGAECLDLGFRLGCRRDHGFYPSTQRAAYAWLAQCLAR